MVKAATKLGRCARSCLFFLNGISMVISTCAVAVGLWVSTEKIQLEILTGSNLHSLSAYLLITVGLVTLLLCFIGCLGIMKEIKCILGIYLIFDIFLFLSVLSSGILIMVFGNELHSTLKQNMITSLEYHYRDDSDSENSIQTAWDSVQRKFRCCGVDSDFDLAAWSTSDWYHRQLISPPAMVPKSCCVTCSELRSSGLISVSACATVPGRANNLTSQIARYCQECSLTLTSHHKFTKELPTNYEWCAGTSQLAKLAWPQPAYVHTQPCFHKVKEEVAAVGLALGVLSLVLAFILLLMILCTVVLLRDLFQLNYERTRL